MKVQTIARKLAFLGVVFVVTSATPTLVGQQSSDQSFQPNSSSSSSEFFQASTGGNSGNYNSGN